MADGLGSVALAGLLEAEIGSGRFPLGDAVPSEASLRERYGVGRHVVREAMSRLEEFGLVQKRQGAATRVVAQQRRSQYVHSLRSLSEVIQFARDTQLEIVDQAMVDLGADDARFVGAAARARWLRLRGVRRAVERNEVIGYSTILAHSRFASALVGLKEPTGPLYALIETASGEIVQEARQTIAAGPVPADAALRLKMSPAETAIKVERHYYDVSGGVMIASLNWHNPATFSYAITLRRDAAG